MASMALFNNIRNKQLQESSNNWLYSCKRGTVGKPRKISLCIHKTQRFPFSRTEKQLGFRSKQSNQSAFCPNHSHRIIVISFVSGRTLEAQILLCRASTGEQSGSKETIWRTADNYSSNEMTIFHNSSWATLISFVHPFNLLLKKINRRLLLFFWKPPALQLPGD